MKQLISFKIFTYGFFVLAVSSVSFLIGYKIKTSPICSNPLPVINSSPTPETCSTNPCIVGGIVYFVDQNSHKKIIATSNLDDTDPTKYIKYQFAKLSPDKQMILLGSTGFENVNSWIYEISTNKKYSVNATGSDYGYWLRDGKLLVIGSCGMGIDCGIFLSKNAKQPWIMEQVADGPSD